MSSFRLTHPLDIISNRCRAFLVGQSVRRLISRFGSVIGGNRVALMSIRSSLNRSIPFLNIGDLQRPLTNQLIRKMYSRVHVIPWLREYFLSYRVRDHIRRVNAQNLHDIDWWSLLQNVIDRSLRILAAAIDRLYRTFYEAWGINAAFQRSNTSKN